MEKKILDRINKLLALSKNPNVNEGNSAMEMAEKLMKEACKKYKNVYFLQTNATDKLHETSVDGTHPGDYGYTIWAKSIEKPLLKILKKYGIK